MIEQTPWTILMLCIAATSVWRIFGVVIANRIDANGALFQWFSCVAYAMLAGLITRILVFPVGSLAQTELTDRAVAMTVGFVVFFALKRNVFVATVTAFLVFLTLAWLRHSGRL